MYEVEYRAAGLCTGTNDRPNSFAPRLAGGPACSLGDLPMNRHESDRLFGHIVCGFDARRRDELEEAIRVQTESLGNVLGLAGSRRLHEGVPTDVVRDALQRLAER